MGKILILGSNGMLGTYLTKYLSVNHEVIPSTRNDLDLSKITFETLEKYIDDLGITSSDYILNASGIIKQRNYDEIEMVKINSLLPYFLSAIKEKYNTNIIHFTTDCVYDGDRSLDILLDENCNHTCNDIYGKSKSLGEPENITIIRTSIIGEEKNNKKSLLEWVISQKGQKVMGFKNHLWNGVTCLELSKQVLIMIEDNISWQGVRHFYSPDTVSKLDLVEYINKVYKLNLIIEEVSTDNNCFRNLSSIYKSPITKTIYQQIIDLKNFNIHE